MVTVPWTWCHSGGRMEIMPGGSMEIKHIDEETISYHTLFTFDVIVLFLFLLVFRYMPIA
jgi:hypothetical protein